MPGNGSCLYFTVLFSVWFLSLFAWTLLRNSRNELLIKILQMI